MRNKTFKLLSFFAILTILGCKGKILGLNGNDAPHSILGTKEGEIEKAIETLKKKIDNSPLEILELRDNFSKSIIRASDDNNYIYLKVVSKADKNKIVEYTYNYAQDNVTGPVPVTLSQGIGSNEKFIEKYEEFKPFLFTETEMPDLKKLPSILADAIKRSGYGEECHVENCTIQRSEQDEKGAIEISVSVQSNKSITASKTFTYDAAGNFIR